MSAEKLHTADEAACQSSGATTPEERAGHWMALILEFLSYLGPR